MGLLALPPPGAGAGGGGDRTLGAMRAWPPGLPRALSLMLAGGIDAGSVQLLPTAAGCTPASSRTWWPAQAGTHDRRPSGALEQGGVRPLIEGALLAAAERSRAWREG